ncbi:MAG TPA: hypothetical protein VMW35_06075 [Myxococcota bacterium]|jgi:hypothetical protein|nr:hypothetical protein [Myxococcota bacterium]
MKRPTSLLGPVLSLAVGAVLVAGCGGPVGPMPGFALEGPPAMQPVQNFLFARDLSTVDLEVRPSAPFSVRLWLVERAGRIYVSGPSWSFWVHGLRQAPDTRILLGAEIYEVRAVEVTDPAEREGVGESGVVFRLDPRPTPEVAQEGP